MTVESTLAELFHTHRNAPSLWLAEQAVRIVREADELIEAVQEREAFL